MYRAEDVAAHFLVVDELSQAPQVATVDAGAVHAALQVDHVEELDDPDRIKLLRHCMTRHDTTRHDTTRHDTTHTTPHDTSVSTPPKLIKFVFRCTSASVDFGKDGGVEGVQVGCERRDALVDHHLRCRNHLPFALLPFRIVLSCVCVCV